MHTGHDPAPVGQQEGDGRPCPACVQPATVRPMGWRSRQGLSYCGEHCPLRSAYRQTGGKQAGEPFHCCLQLLLGAMRCREQLAQQDPHTIQHTLALHAWCSQEPHQGHKHAKEQHDTQKRRIDCR